MIKDQKADVFWEIMEVLRRSALLPHIMIIGSWAEYLYPYYLGEDYFPNLKTQDIDLFFENPWREVDGAETLIENFRAADFLLDEHFAEASKFFKEGLEVEFLSTQMGSGPGIVEIPFTGVRAEKLSALDMLKPLLIEVRGYEIRVPSPASYIAHKLYINPERRPISKRPKDIEAVRSLLQHLMQKPQEIRSLQDYMQNLSNEKRMRIAGVAAANVLDIPGL